MLVKGNLNPFQVLDLLQVFFRVEMTLFRPAHVDKGGKICTVLNQHKRRYLLNLSLALAKFLVKPKLDFECVFTTL